MGTPSGNLSAGRDSLGRIVTVIQPLDTTRIAYDSLGRVDSLRRARQKLAWTWDGSLPLSETWSGAVNGSVSTTWDANFRPTSQTAAGSSISYTYDLDGTLTHAGSLSIARDPVSGFASGDTVGSIVHRVGRNGQGEIVSDTTLYQGAILSCALFTRDSLGRILTKTDSTNGTKTLWRYHYDLAGRLDSAWANGALNAWYGYDANGVRTSGTGVSGVSVDAQDRLISANGATYAYNGMGQLVSRSNASGTTRYHYTLQGELVSVKLATGDSIAYTLDPSGRRIARSLNGTTTHRWLWEGELRPVAEVDSVGNVLTRYVYATHTNVPDYLVRGGVTYKILADERGSVRSVVNVATGAVVSSLTYDVWGNVTASVNPGFQPFGFAGGLRDDATGLIRFSARDYDPAIGRWTGKDPIGFSGGLSNLYGYVGNDPVNAVDVSGLAAQITCFTHSNKKEYTGTVKVRDIPGSIIVDSHGSPTGLYGSIDDNQPPIPLTNLILAIQGYPGYLGASSITLLGCNTGNPSQGVPLAQIVANILGLPVTAPTGILHIDETTGIITVTQDPNNGGFVPPQMKTFYPTAPRGF